MKTKNILSNVEEITFGVEIETTIPAGLIQVGHYHNGVAVVLNPGMSGSPAPTFQGMSWKAERDGSIQVTDSRHTACEFVSPILKGEAGLKHLMEFVQWLVANGAQVNRSCGFHVHVGIASFSTPELQAEFVNQVARLATQNATALYAQTGSILREQGSYCQKPGSAYRKVVGQMKRAKSSDLASSTSRYTLVNISNVQRGTVEFRCFAGTLNQSKILLHVFSALACCRIAQTRKTQPTWEPSAPLSGRDALKNFLKVRPMWEIVSAPTFAACREEMISKGFEMAAKYDAARTLTTEPSLR